MKLKSGYEDYTEEEFIQLVNEICSAKEDELLESFVAVTEYPEGSDLIYYYDDDNATPKRIVSAVKAWRKAHSKRSFKS